MAVDLRMLGPYKVLHKRLITCYKPINVGSVPFRSTTHIDRSSCAQRNEQVLSKAKHDDARVIELNTTPNHTHPTQQKAQVSPEHPLIELNFVQMWGWGVYGWG